MRSLVLGALLVAASMVLAPALLYGLFYAVHGYFTLMHTYGVPSGLRSTQGILISLLPALALVFAVVFVLNRFDRFREEEV